MSFKSLKVTRKELIGILKNRQVSIKKGLPKKQLLKILKYYDYSDLLKLAQIRRVNVAEDDTIDDLEEKLITNVNLKKAHKELLSIYSNKIDNIRKSISYLEQKLTTNASLKKAHNQLLRIYSDKIDSIRKEIEYLERRIYFKNEQHKITNALKLLRQRKLVKRSQDGSISYDDLVQVRKLLKLSKKEINKIAQITDINTANVRKRDLIYMLLRSNSNVKESKYLEHVNENLVTNTEEKVNEIRTNLIEIGKIITNKEIKKYSKDVYDIIKLITSLHEERVKYYPKLSNSVKYLFDNAIKNRKIKKRDMNKINDYLDSILNNIQYKRK